MLFTIERKADPITSNCFLFFMHSILSEVGNGSVLKGFGNQDDFRIDEDIHKARVIVTMYKKCEHQLI